MHDRTDTYQACFERRWGHLRRARVRALAWLLDAPDLLDIHDPHWEGRVATLGLMTPDTERWLRELDADPAPLDAALGAKMTTRLGLYAEKLMAFYFAHQGRLVAHGLQVRASRNDTVGEFDFLLDAGEGVEHIEFATKFYLLQDESAVGFDTFVGPNLADSLGRKMRKVFDRQLLLGSHPAAQNVLPRPVVAARALVKGWLFYPRGTYQAMQGITAGHCRGFWCALAELDALPGDRFLILPRLQWLPPFRAQSATWMLDKAQLAAELADHFMVSDTPVLVALVREQSGNCADAIVEFERGFIVPDDWRERARSRLRP
ncbi:DUF1853 family protein [Massilia sp. Root335]|uniref:DUF1853 family protein n=1 Tax=Massilia sp. Root335 TaxID=1736517 RepID=UPI0007007B52|nr:DUF1853 family protein [Massilia sp. Root335]KQV30568.1 hypothetical protein ASC93_03735 [Massilia sp. Root335]